MPVAELLELARSGSYDKLEARALELLETAQLKLADLVSPYQELEQHGQADKLGTLTQMILENADVTTDPGSALALARIALIGSPTSDDLRRHTIDLYRRLYGDRGRFDSILAASGLTGGRPVRNALNLLDLCLTLQPGDTLISHMDDRVVELTAIDRENGLFTLRREGRVTTLPAPEVAREYARIGPDDFRVLRQLRPQRLAQLIREDPVAVVLGLIRAHGGQVDADLLKHELVPRYIDTKEWSRWWTNARAQLKRSPHVTIEGRAPVILRYNREARTLEQETEDALTATRDPLDWLATVESYIREKHARKETPDARLLWLAHDHIANDAKAMRARRPAEALTAALVLMRLADKGLPLADDTRDFAAAILRDAEKPALLLGAVPHENLRERGLEIMRQARPADWLEHALAWLPHAPAALLDKLAAAAAEAGRLDVVQGFIAFGLSDPARNPELMFWLWKGSHVPGLQVPGDAELFQTILDTLSALGRTVSAEPETTKGFRHRMKAALALRDYAKVAEVFRQTSDAAAITLRRQLDRLEGLGANAPSRMLDLLRDVHPTLWIVQRTAPQPWEDKETIWCTPEGLHRRTLERDELVNRKMPENAKRIGEAASHGDLSENSEYKFALEERDLLRARLAKINDELSRARTLSLHDVPTDHVGIGSRVRLRDVAGGAERVMTFLGPFETDVDRGIYSYLSPFAQKLMGCHVGDRVRVTLDGHDTDLEVVSIENALAPAAS